MTGETRTAGVVAALAAALGFATLALWGKFAPQVGLSAQTFLVFRFGLAALVLGLIASRTPLEPRERLRQIAFGGVYTVQTSLYFLALEQVSAGVTTLLLYLAPGFVVLYEWLLGTRPQRAQLAGLALSSVGLIVIVGLPSASDGNATGFSLRGTLGRVLRGVHRRFRAVVPRKPPPRADRERQSRQRHRVHRPRRIDEHPASPLEPERLGCDPRRGGVRHAAGDSTDVPRDSRARRDSRQFAPHLEPVFVAGLAFAFLDEGLTPAKLVGGGLILIGALLAQGFSSSQPRV
ncbi:MAG: DMT family transporter [Pleurocapsa sp. SU_196_0]|nr:DMT family transporter [Pleurocapsa sp. SU_196_0]